MQTSQKTCFKCGVKKDIAEFYRHKMMADGHLNKCKDCTCADARKTRVDNIDYYRAYDVSRGSRMTAEDVRKQRAKYPDRTKAHNAVNKAVMRGKLQKQPCEYCGSSTVHAHHDDYSKPLEVRWLCALHHRQVHSSSSSVVLVHIGSDSTSSQIK